LIAALQMLRVMKERNTRLSDLAKCWKRFPQLVTNVRVREKKPFEQLDACEPDVRVELIDIARNKESDGGHA